MTRIANELFWEQGLYDNALEKCPYPVGESLRKALQLKACSGYCSCQTSTHSPPKEVAWSLGRCQVKLPLRFLLFAATIDYFPHYLMWILRHMDWTSLISTPKDILLRSIYHSCMQTVLLWLSWLLLVGALKVSPCGSLLWSLPKSPQCSSPTENAIAVC